MADSNSKSSSVGRRGPEDDEWKRTKEFVRSRDGGRCRLPACLSPAEAIVLKPGYPAILDCAHVLAASTRPDLVYEPRNVVLLRRFVHRRLDDYQNPLTGSQIDSNEHYYWWWRLLVKKVAPYDATFDYETVVFDLVQSSKS